MKTTPPSLLLILLTLVASVGLLASGGTAAAQGTAPAATASESDPAGDVVVVSAEDTRAIPDYDGREAPAPSFGDVLLWIPRILFFPVYLTVEYGLRAPFGALVTATERYEVPDKLVGLFRFGDRDQILLAPTFSLDLGFRANIGLSFRYEDLFAEGHDVYAEGAFGGTDWWFARVGTQFATSDDRLSLRLEGTYMTRADLQFFGLGLAARDELASGYGINSWDATLDGTYRIAGANTVSAGATYTARTFREGACPPQLHDRLEAGELAELPHGYEDGYTAVSGFVRFVLDTREERPAPGSGFRLKGEFTLGTDPETGDTWARYGGALTSYFDFSGVQHVLSLRVQLEFVDALEGKTPFNELIFLGGTGPMSGFVQGRLSGASGAAVVAEYTWPIWFFAVGKVHAAVGNVFDQQLDGLRLRNMRLSAGVGLAAVADRTELLEFILGFGTDTFARGTGIESVRLMVGATREF